jgi:uncharacterized repeat protein (TIGR01451 family)
MRSQKTLTRLRGAAGVRSLAACGILLAGLCAAPGADAQGTGADVGVTKTAEPGSYTAGSTVPYTIVVESNGPATANGVHLTDTTPPNTTFVSLDSPVGWVCATPAPGGAGTINCTASSLSPNTSATFTLNLRVNNGVLPGVRITNTASVSSNAPDPFPSNNSSSASFLAVGGSRDTAGVYDPTNGAWFLKNTNAAGNADLTFFYGSGGPQFVPIDGDWNSDGIDTVGLYDQSTGAFFLRNSNSSGPADIVFNFGLGNQGFVPLSGDWNGDGVDTVGLYQPSTGAFFLKNTNTSGNADITFTFGLGNIGYVPLAGDWNGDGVDTVGLYNPVTATFFLKNSNTGGNADLSFVFGAANAVPLAGDWDGDAFGTDTIGIYVPATGTWFLKNTNAAGNADITFVYGPPNLKPVTGDWNGL